MPRSIYDVLRWAEFLWLTYGTYRMAAQRVVRYFLTQIELTDASDDEKEKYEKFLLEELHIMDVLATAGDNYMCFHGDVKAVTAAGSFRLRDLAGKTVEVLSEGGVYRPAKFKSFGRQELLEVEFSDGRKVLTTPGHQWVVAAPRGKTIRVATTELAGRHVPRVVAVRPERNDDFREGIRHGFTFGGGTLYNGGRQARAQFFGLKDRVMLQYFQGLACKPYLSNNDGSYIIHGLPPHYKSLPVGSASPSYWYGFVCGFLAADGTVDTYGCALLTQKSREILERIVEQLPRIGMVAGPIRKQNHKSRFKRSDGRIDTYDTETHFVTLLKRFMDPEDFLTARHRSNFASQRLNDSSYGKYIGVRAVRSTGRFEEVFCCVEHQTHTFVIDNGILTGNCYGNAFVTLSVPFRRYLRCPKCALERPIAKVKYSFSLSNAEFRSECPDKRCGYKGAFERCDRRSLGADPIRVIFIPPQEIRTQYHPLTGHTNYFWQIPGNITYMITSGNAFYLEHTAWEVIEAVKDKQKLFRFAPDVLYHLKDETIAGVRSFAWGIPLVMSNFKQAWYIQVLKRYNEAIALDYIIPFRVITPEPGTSREADPVLHTNLATFYGRVMTMFRQHRKDPTSIHALPFPIKMQMLGADGKELAPMDLIDKATDEFLNSQGVPAELYRGTLQLQAMPTALRLFERTWVHLVTGLNGLTGWLFKSISGLQNWENMKGRLQPVTLAENLEDKQIRLQLSAGQQISRQTAFAPFGINIREEIRKMLQEQAFQQEEMTRFSKEQSQKQKLQDTFEQGSLPPPQMQPGMPGGPMGPMAGGAGGAGGAGQPTPQGQGAPQDPSQAQGQVPGPGGTPGVPMGTQPAGPASGGVTPEDLMAQAEQIAYKLLTESYEQRRSELLQLKKSNGTLHAIVLAKLNEIRDRAKQSGGQQVISQMAAQMGAQVSMNGPGG